MLIFLQFVFKFNFAIDCCCQISEICLNIVRISGSYWCSFVIFFKFCTFVVILDYFTFVQTETFQFSIYLSSISSCSMLLLFSLIKIYVSCFRNCFCLKICETFVFFLYYVLLCLFRLLSCVYARMFHKPLIFGAKCLIICWCDNERKILLGLCVLFCSRLAFLGGVLSCAAFTSVQVDQISQKLVLISFLWVVLLLWMFCFFFHLISVLTFRKLLLFFKILRNLRNFFVSIYAVVVAFFSILKFRSFVILFVYLCKSCCCSFFHFQIFVVVQCCYFLNALLLLLICFACRLFSGSDFLIVCCCLKSQ